MNDFAHLHVHTEYSLLDGLAHISDLVGQAQALGMHHLAITDHGNLHGVLAFFQTCRAEGIHPLIGMEAYFCQDIRHKGKQSEIGHLLLLAETQEGYTNLLRLSTEANCRGFHYHPRVDHAMLEKYHTGLIATSSCLSGEIPRLLLTGDMKGARASLDWFLQIFGKERFFIEYQDHRDQDPAQERVNRHLYELMKACDVEGVVTNDSHYVWKGDAPIHDLFFTMQQQRRLDDPERYRFGSDQYYLKSPEEMSALFPDHPEWSRNTLRIAERCQVDPTACRGGLPVFAHPCGFASPRDYLYHLAMAGLQERYGHITEEMRARIDYEVGIIERKNFISYFLVQWDLVRFARSRGILCLARGSAAGSLLAYALSITNVDPLRFDLLFERFYSQERTDSPDIDMDYQDDRRAEVLRYAAEKYGTECVAQMVTFHTLGAKQAVRDVARAMGESHLGDQIASTIDSSLPLRKAMEAPAPLMRAGTFSSARLLLERAARIEGYIRNTGVHAAGFIIADRPLYEVAPLAFRDRERPEAGMVIQYEQKYFEGLGLIKYDFLGQATLTIIHHTLDLIAERTGQCITVQDILFERTGDPDKDAMRARTFAMLSRGDTSEVFQLEGAEMTAYLQQLKPSCIEDLMAMIALYRPGPKESIPDFIAAKHGKKKVQYLDPRLEQWLGVSYGVIVYQDQVLQIARHLAGFSWEDVHAFRKALSKKQDEVIALYEIRFVDGCVQNGVPQDKAKRLFTLIAPFGGYGFNKAHAASYAVVAYYTAYLKANYPLEYMAAAMTTEAGDGKQIAALVATCKARGIPVLPPDVNASAVPFTVEGNAIRYGLVALKGLGHDSCQEIVRARGERPFSDLVDFCARVDGRAGGKSVKELLIWCGACDAFGERHRLLASLDVAMSLGRQQHIMQKTGQSSLFALDEGHPSSIAFTLKDVPPCPASQRLRMERDVTGVYFSAHPLDAAVPALSRATTHQIAQITEAMEKVRVTIGGIVKEVRPIRTKKGEPMAMLLLEDLSGEMEIAVFPRLYAQVRDFCQKDRFLLVQATVSVRNARTGLIAESVDPFALPDGTPEPEGRPRMLYLTVSHLNDHDPEDEWAAIITMQRVHTIMRNHPGRDHFEILVERADCFVRIGSEHMTCRSSPELYAKLVTLLGEDAVQVVE